MSGLHNGIKFIARRFYNLRRQIGTQNGRILTSEYPDEKMPRCSLNEFVLANAHKWGDKIATECAFTGRKYTYDEIIKKSRNLNRALRQKLKLNRGDVIACLLPNIPEFSIAIFGALKAGLTLTTINTLYTVDEILKHLNDSDAKALITTNGKWKTAYTAVQLSKKNIPIISIQTEFADSTPSGAIKFSEFTDNEYHIDDIPYADPDDLALLPYSSGTTGLPKGVELTHYNIVSELTQMLRSKCTFFRDTTENWQDVVPVLLPMFHMFGLTTVTLQSLTDGAKLVTIPNFTSESYIKMLKDQRPNILFMVPPTVMFLTNHIDVLPEHLKSVRTIVCGAAPLGATDEKNFYSKFNLPITLLQGYGMTETSAALIFMREELKKKYSCFGSIGIPLMNTEIKFVSPDDPRGPPLGPNELGEIVCRGPQVMRGYHNRPEETKKTFVDGWLRTGDLGYYDENGLIYVTDRMKELIKVKGYQVPPAELEALLRSHLDVADAAVIGVPHPQYGEVPRAYVVPKVGKSIDPAKLEAFVKEKVADFKRLRGGVSVVMTIPKNPSGKILRRQLKEEYFKQIETN